MLKVWESSISLEVQDKFDPLSTFKSFIATQSRRISQTFNYSEKTLDKEMFVRACSKSFEGITME